ncbi:hypothetical protein ABBQ32_010880 [Trebouxia sp. C0010 RCD-2024]
MHLTRISQSTKHIGRICIPALSAARDSLQCATERYIQIPSLTTPNACRAFHTLPFLGKDEGGQATGYGSSQVEEDRTGGKPQSGGPKPTEYGTMPRPGIPTRENNMTGRDPDKTQPRTGTTGGGDGEPNMTPGSLPPGYDQDKPRPASAAEQEVSFDKMQGKGEKMGHLGRDPRKDTGGPKPDFGKDDPQKSEEDVMQRGEGQGSLDRVDAGESAGMPKEATPPSSSPQEHHPAKREGQGPVGPGDSWDPSSTTPSLDKTAGVSDPRAAPKQRRTDGPSQGSPQPGKYAEELTENVRPNETPKGPQDTPPAVPSASKGAI